MTPTDEETIGVLNRETPVSNDDAAATPQRVARRPTRSTTE